MQRLTFILLIITYVYSQQTVRIKDVAKIGGLEDIQLFGYGLVVGLDGTGDRSQTVFTEQSVVNMLKNMGIELPEKRIRLRNVASVMVTGTLSPFKRKGTRFDVTVSSMGDATSLEGGTLILTQLQGPDGKVYALAQGPLATGGYDIRNRGLSYVKKNHVLVGRIPDGAIVQQEYVYNVLKNKELSISLSSPDFTSAVQMTEAINKSFDKKIARAVDAATVILDFSKITGGRQGEDFDIVSTISQVENLTFEISSQAKVIINEKTGTIVAGGNVKISEVAVSHGSIKVEIRNVPEAIQPKPFIFSGRETPPSSQTLVEEKEAEMVVLDGTTTVSDLSNALNSLGVSPRDVIAILQAIKEAGALHAQLVIL